jgi:replication initiation and membrane attachment protein DnaB
MWFLERIRNFLLKHNIAREQEDYSDFYVVNNLSELYAIEWEWSKTAKKLWI